MPVHSEPFGLPALLTPATHNGLHYLSQARIRLNGAVRNR